MRIDPDTCRDPDLLAAEVRRLQAVLEELRSAADQADAEYRAEIDRLAKPDPTPLRNGTPGECAVPPAWLARPYWVDPPSGWAYGFPLLYDPAKDGDMVAWMIASGYPERLARQGLPCTFTAASDEKLSENDKP